MVDNLERAVGAEGTVEEMKEGVELIRRQMEELLKRHGVERVAADGGRFDPSSHEAVARHESDEVREPTIVKELTGRLLAARSLVAAGAGRSGRSHGAGDR